MPDIGPGCRGNAIDEGLGPLHTATPVDCQHLRGSACMGREEGGRAVTEGGKVGAGYESPSWIHFMGATFIYTG